MESRKRIAANYVCILLILAIGVRVALFSQKQWQDVISGRPELSTPVSSFRRVQESAFYLSRGKSPYDGEIFHQAPLVLALFLPVFMMGVNKDTAYLIFATIYILIDLLIAYELVVLTQYTTFIGEETSCHKVKSREPLLQRVPMSPFLQNNNLPYVVAAIYLLNPYTIASCVAMSTSVLTQITIMLCLNFATKKMPIAAAFFIGLSTYLSIYPIMLLFPVALHLVKNYRAHSDQMSASSPDKIVHIKVKKLVVFAVAYLASIGGLLYTSFSLTGSWDFLQKSYGWILTYNDLTPNIGVFWYFFIEMFSRFVPYFLLLLYSHPFMYVVPLFLRLSHRPQAFACALIGIMTVFQSYPSLGDFGFYISISAIHPEILLNIQHKYAYLLGLTLATYMLPLMWYLWLYPASGNANFYYGQTLVFQIFASQLIVAFVDAALRRDKWIEQSEKLRAHKCMN